MTDDEIQKVAIAMCENLGLNPYEDVSFGDGETETPLEMIGKEFYHSMSMSGQRWMLYRKQAALAIAAHRAVSEVTQ